MQQSAQESLYIVVRAEHLPLFSMPKMVSQLIGMRTISPTPEAAIDVFLNTLSFREMPNIMENYLVAEYTCRNGQYILIKHSDLTAENIYRKLLDRYLQSDRHNLQLQEIQQRMQFLLNDNQGIRRPRAEQVAQLAAAQLRRDIGVPAAARLNLQPPLPPVAPAPARINPAQQPAAAPSPAQRDNLQAHALSPHIHWAQRPMPAAMAGAVLPINSPQRRNDDRNVTDISAMIRFLGMTDEQINNSVVKKFFTRLQQILHKDFFQQNTERQFSWIMNNRRNQDLSTLLRSNPPLACQFLDKIIANNPQQRSQLKATRLGTLYELTEILDQRAFQQRYGHLEHDVQIRKAEQIYIRIIEHRRVQMLQRQAERERQRQPLIVPQVKEGLRTQQIHELHEQDKLSHAIDDTLCCMFTGRLFKDPVKLHQMGKDFYFERSHILLWHSSKQKADGTALNPLNNVPFRREELQEAPDMVARVNEFKKSVEDDLVAHANTDAHPYPSAAAASPSSPGPSRK